MGEEAKTAARNGDEVEDSIDGIGSAAGSSAQDVNDMTEALKRLGEATPPSMPWFKPGAPGSTAPGQNPLDIFTGGASSGPGFTIGGPGAPQFGGPGESLPGIPTSNMAI